VAEPKAFLPTVKKAGGDTAAEMTQAFMKSTNQEGWHKLNYFDEDVRCPPPETTSMY
jgi:DNA-directed RNA polymerase-3 subunit RPC5